jgi:hypothetical protein
MRMLVFALLVLAGCGQAAPPPPLPSARAEGPRTWFICDGVDAPSLIVFAHDGAVVRMAEYQKPNGIPILRDDFTIGELEGAAGSIYTPLINSGVASGAIRETDTAMLENPASAYTPYFAAVRLGERSVSCRWLPRTRLFAFTSRRSIVVHEDVDGDLIYTAYGFTDVNALAPVELSENARTTPFSVEVRGGEETISPSGVQYRFNSADGYTYVVAAARNGDARLDVLHAGAPTQSEDILAFQEGDAAQP